jgi:ureidoacrylate peracid hydrolase
MHSRILVYSCDALWRGGTVPKCAVRSNGIVIMYTTIESLTLDGKDQSLDYKILGFHVIKMSWDGRVIDQIASRGDEIILAKTSSSVIISTNITMCCII